MIRIKVPATSANIGVGFDCMGLAVSLYSNVDFEPSKKKLEIYGCPEEFRNENNLVYKAFVNTCDFLNEPVPNVRITIENNIPVARGLGSSAFCIVAGIKGANDWFDAPLSNDEILDLATNMEGHPDNVSPAIYGKLGVSFIDENKDVQTVHFNVNPSLRFVTMIPNYEVSTDKAREILPTEMSYSEAIYQVGHAVALSKAMELGNLKLIRECIIDKMHEPYRSKLIPDYENAKNICEKANGTMYISGSGSTMMAIVDNEKNAEKIVENTKKDFPDWKVYHLNVDTKGAISEVI
ncbi:homoserine kinase [Companilactobacillus ginsenosidimutans]|uniref:Homoserine kinase n=1 Tax=Companilactobacillus ginsenosidimutans TaxID=1007676 RepID=A0A0H4QE82_9LACO|nr:homoserine kinase [Companilactobacillus ginsenosidimutans]AKP66247.1 serine kinase [Companilactobacillus ginsenosidimutans]